MEGNQASPEPPLFFSSAFFSPGFFSAEVRSTRSKVGNCRTQQSVSLHHRGMLMISLMMVMVLTSMPWMVGPKALRTMASVSSAGASEALRRTQATAATGTTRWKAANG